VSKKSKTNKNKGNKPPVNAPQVGLFVATPTLDGRIHAGCVASIMQVQRMCIDAGIKFTWKIMSGNSILPLARNELVKHFLATPSTHMFMIDSDIQVDARHVMYLLGHDRDISALPCSKREVLWDRLGEFIKAYPQVEPSIYSSLIAEGNFSTEAEVFDVDEFGFAKVLKIGTGAMMVKRTVFEKMIDSAPENYLETATGPMYQFFSYTVDPETRIQYGEDYTFCNRWRQIGGTVDMLIAAKTTHHGQIGINFDWKAIATAITAAQEAQKEKRNEA
jgi:hypothetical protein